MRVLICGLVLAATFVAAPTLAAPPHPPGAHPEPPPCPAEQLSCGKQTPVISDGSRLFENDEMGLRAVFPAGSRVCMSRSGDAPRGFYAWYGTTAAGCPERGDIPATFMGISSSFNALSYKSLREASHDCRPLSPVIRARLHGSLLKIAGHDSLACQSDGQNGELQIIVYALAGRPTDEGAPGVVYFASLGSRADRLDGDLAMFRAFLGRLRVGVR